IRAVIEEKNPDLAGRDEVARQVGVGAIIFSVLATRRTKDVDITFEDILNFEGHTGPYVQYTHARCASILRRAGGVPETADLSLLSHPEEWEVAKMVGSFADRVALAGRDAEPSVVAQYLLSLCEAFSRYYNLGSGDPTLKVLTEDAPTAAARLTLVAGVREVLARGLWLLGIGAPEEM
ncbi:MAG: DALR anticodon-binding domain-containing protein, partial [Planctomycetota bacterium]